MTADVDGQTRRVHFEAVGDVMEDGRIQLRPGSTVDVRPNGVQVSAGPYVTIAEAD